MRIRSIIFWSHLMSGVLAGLVILMMSITGVLLTYERQIIAWAEDGYLPDSQTGKGGLPADDLIASAKRAEPEAKKLTMTFKNDADAVLRVSAGNNRDLLLDPATGVVLLQGQSSTRRFFRTVMYVHRWFAMSGDSRATGRAITSYSNLLFLFLLCSGIYLWLPRIWSRAAVKTQVLFNSQAESGKARDYNWHHVFSFWAFIPLFVIMTTATVFYFPWSNALVYNAFGEQPPQRGRGGSDASLLENDQAAISYDELLTIAKTEAQGRGVTDWKSISLEVPAVEESDARFRIDTSIGGQPANVYRLTLNRQDGSVEQWQTFADNTPGSRARSTIRFLHTGEVLGFFGQTLAGLSSLAACFLVWTGLALAWRRLVRPLFSHNAAQASS